MQFQNLTGICIFSFSSYFPILATYSISTHCIYNTSVTKSLIKETPSFIRLVPFSAVLYSILLTIIDLSLSSWSLVSMLDLSNTIYFTFALLLFRFSI